MASDAAAENMNEVGPGYVFKEEIHLTVLKTSLFFAGDGFTVYDCKGQLVFRVDSYGPDTRDRDELVLMDPNGRCLLTVRRKRPSLHQRWEGFKGERMDGDKPIFSVKRASIIGRSRASLTVEMYDNPGEEYQIEGCFSQRCCTVFNVTKESVAEIRRKVDPTTSVVLGKEVFSLCVKAGFDAAFAMGFVLVLDQINGEDYADSGATAEPAVHPTTDD
ncbi:protein LURP-one-related 12-like [Vigna unguiculata]|uniref:Translation initiation factor eIF-2B subunit alpha n=1 Tax=Vigna unguiculata TaxID=3917 RepID=A0A4D6N4Z4_VIGUN|nr:protein LURP-one-related 12-like [Vigna unguiculata]QCE08873.1 translation initiation factor eIF-2B subunit alpha [Vigna unguiculata]